MKIGVCGIACEVCPRMVRGQCPSGERGCVAWANPYCAVSNCAHSRGKSYCFQCEEFPCATMKEHGALAYDYCLYLAGKQA
jgi:hypothetical protein